MGITTITIDFTPAEAEALSHRLEHLADHDYLEELFDEELYEIEDFDLIELADFCSTAVTNINTGGTMIALERPEHVAAIVEAVEGSTVIDIARDEVSAGRRPRQHAEAVDRVLRSAANKIKLATGRDVCLP